MMIFVMKVINLSQDNNNSEWENDFLSDSDVKNAYYITNNIQHATTKRQKSENYK